MKVIDVLTFTLGGRDRYLYKCLDSVYNDISQQLIKDEYGVNHHLILQGERALGLADVIRKAFADNSSYKLIIHAWPKNIGSGPGLNKVLPECTSDLIFKMDDDCEIISKDFFESAYSIYEKFPNACFNAYPVGLTGNPGGVRGHSHSVWHDKYRNRVYTMRHVDRLGGFSRFSPAKIIKSCVFPDDLSDKTSGSEDVNFAAYCNTNGVPMFYLENSLIVEHAESTYGQIVRYPEYFAGRSNEGSMKFGVIE